LSIGARLREERLRLGLSQPAFAALAGVTKGALVKWEKDTAAPNAVALVAFAASGTDILYVLTGKRSAEKPEIVTGDIAEQLREIERDLLDPTLRKLPHWSEQEAEDHFIEVSGNRLRSMLKHDTMFMTPEMVEHANSLLEITADPKKLILFRKADHAQKRKERDRKKESIAAYVDDSPYEPNEAVRNMMVILAMDYGVPAKVLADLTYDIFTDITERQAQGLPIGKD